MMAGGAGPDVRIGRHENGVKRFANCTRCHWTRDLSDSDRWMDAITSHVARYDHPVAIVHIQTYLMTPSRPAEPDTQ